MKSEESPLEVVHRGGRGAVYRGPPRSRVFPQGLPGHGVVKCPLAACRSCQSDQGKSNHDHAHEKCYRNRREPGSLVARSRRRPSSGSWPARRCVPWRQSCRSGRSCCTTGGRGTSTAHVILDDTPGSGALSPGARVRVGRFRRQGGLRAAGATRAGSFGGAGRRPARPSAAARLDTKRDKGRLMGSRGDATP